MVKKKLENLCNTLDRYKILPVFDSDAIFLIAITSLMIVYLYPEAYQFILLIKAYSMKIIIILILGVFFALYDAIFTVFRSEFKKHFAYRFALIINILFAYASIIFLNQSHAEKLSYVGPWINIIISAVVLIFLYLDVLDTTKSSYKVSSYSNIVYGTVIVIGLSFLFKYQQISWPVMFTMVVGYVTLLNRLVIKHLPSILNKKHRLVESIDGIVNSMVTGVLHDLNDGQWFDVCIIDGQNAEYLDIPDEYGNNLSAFIEKETKGRANSSSGLIVVYLAEYTVSSLFFSDYKELTITIDVYPIDSKKGYRFIQAIKKNPKEVYEFYRGLMYIKDLVRI